jgi:hypothetical protein
MPAVLHGIKTDVAICLLIDMPVGPLEVNGNAVIHFSGTY